MVIKNKFQNNNMKHFLTIFLLLMFLGTTYAQTSITSGSVFLPLKDDIVLAVIQTMVDYGDNATSIDVSSGDYGRIHNTSYVFFNRLLIPNNVELNNFEFNMIFQPSCDIGSNDTDANYSAKVTLGSPTNIKYVSFENYCTKVLSGQQLYESDLPILTLDFSNMSLSGSSDAFTGYNRYTISYLYNEFTKGNVRQLYTASFDNIAVSLINKRQENERTLETAITRLFKINSTIWEILFFFVIILTLFFGILILPLRALSMLRAEMKKIFKK